MSTRTSQSTAPRTRAQDAGPGGSDFAPPHPSLQLVGIHSTPNRRRSDLPRGVHSQTISMLDTPEGRVRVRTRRYDYRDRIGGQGAVWSSRFEIAIETEVSRAAGDGFVVLSTGADGVTGGRDHLEAYLQACDWIEAELARVSKRRAADRPAVQADRQPAPPMPDGGEAKGDGTSPAPARRLRRVPPAESTWEGLRRLLNARCNQLQQITGELASETRHEAAAFASGDRVVRGVGGAVRSSKQLTTDEMAQAVSWVEDKLHREGFDLEADQEAYEARCRERAGMAVSDDSTSAKRAA